VQYRTLSKIIGSSHQGYSTGPEKTSKIICAPDHSITRWAKAAVALCPVLKTFIVIVYIILAEG